MELESLQAPPSLKDVALHNHEYLLAFSCKRRHFCPSCHQKRVVEFGEWLCANVLKKVPHRHFVFSIPKFLRRYFLYDRKLLHDLSRCAWESLKVFFQEVIPEKNPVPGAVIAIQTFGDVLGFNPHCHILLTDGCFYGKGMFRVAPPLELKKLEAIFRRKIFCMLIAKGKISREMIAMLSTWRHSGFHVFCGNRIQPREEEAIENLARYIIRASFSQERMQYLADEGTVIYSVKGGNNRKVFDAPEWLAAMLLACTEPRGTDGPVLRFLQQRLPGEKAEEVRRRRCLVHHRIRQVPGGLPEKLGQADSKNL